MSVVDQIKNLFSKKPTESELDSRLSLAMPDDSSVMVASETVQEAEHDIPLNPKPSIAKEAEPVAAVESVSTEVADHITLPVIMPVQKYSEDKDAPPKFEDERINQAAALWARLKLVVLRL